MPAILMIVIMLGLVWFMQRGQRKQAQERQNQLNAVQAGDEVVMIGGLYGKVDEVDQDAKKVVLDVEGVYLTFELAAIKRVVSKADDNLAIETASQAPAEDSQVESAVSSDDTAETAIDSKED